MNNKKAKNFIFGIAINVISLVLLVVTFTPELSAENTEQKSGCCAIEYVTNQDVNGSIQKSTASNTVCEQFAQKLTTFKDYTVNSVTFTVGATCPNTSDSFNLKP
ncbi:MAG: hypothetical protein ABUK01_13760 [Leptospirales bacterium]